jgi:phage shock protein E
MYSCFQCTQIRLDCVFITYRTCRLEENLKNTRPTILFRLLALAIFYGMVPLATSAADLVPFTDIMPAQAMALIKEKSADPLFKILDVRTPEEFALNYVKGALNIDVKAADFAKKIAKLDRDGTYLVYCKGGVRSARAMNLMKEAGFKQVYNLAGGLKKWQEEKLPLEAVSVQAAAAPPS